MNYKNNLSFFKRNNGYMPLKDHFNELRQRFIICLASTSICSIIGWYIYPYILKVIQTPIKNLDNNHITELNFAGIVTAFDLQVQMSIFIGIIMSLPIFIYEVWAFLSPGFTKKERKYSLIFLVSSVPLFLMGSIFAWILLPNLIKVMMDFIPYGSYNIIPARDYIYFVLCIGLSFGISFMLPLLLVGLNLLGLLPFTLLVKSWRIILFLVSLFAAIVAPGNDALGMFFLAAPLLILLALASLVIYCLDKQNFKK